MHLTSAYRLYRALSWAALPIVWQLEKRKQIKSLTPKSRTLEKLGHPTEQRPDGQLFWFHAASVGESKSILPLICKLGELRPDLHFLITSGTATSAALIAQNMPPRSVHQFAPLDAPGPVARFLTHWRPEAGVFVESELWPNLIVACQRRDVPLALINARLSQKSLQKWASRPKTAKLLFGGFRFISAQTEAVAAALKPFTDLDHIVTGLNLKAHGAPLPVDENTLSQAKTALNGRPVWVAASTHAGEEEIVLQAHKDLLQTHPDLCLILAPRHPERGDEIAGIISNFGWPAPRRSLGDWPSGPVYLADTLGELGTWYAATDTVFLGGSLFPIGGHNPFEALQSGARLISGPHVENFAEIYEELRAENAVTFAANSDEIAQTVLARPHAPSTPISGDQTADALEGFAQDLLTALEA